MKLLSLNKIICLIILLIFNFNLSFSEEPVDIWKKKNEKIKKSNESLGISNKNLKNQNSTIKKKNVEIKEELPESFKETKLYGIFDPSENNFNLNFWKNTDGKEFKNIISRINKLKLSTFAEKIFINTLYTYSYLPKDISEEDFLEIKINWIIDNNKDELAETFLEKNNEFKNKKKLIQYLVDKNISTANIAEGCKKVNFISKDIQDSYLQKFKIYCLIFNNKKNQANLLLDILREQGKSDKFFDSKVNFLLGISEKDDGNINDKNLLNFYLSSITVKNFNYEPKKNTQKSIWEYLDSANLININDFNNKDKIKSLELAAQEDRLEKDKIFDIYKKIPFDLNTLMNAQNLYQSLDNSDARALIYQKFLLSDNNLNQVKLLFVLKDLFRKDNLQNVYMKFLSDRLKEIDEIDIPKDYEQAFKNNIIKKSDTNLGRVKYDDKILHRSKVLKYFVDKNGSLEKSQKDLNNIYKKIKRNKNYFFSAKDLALVESLKNEGFKIPKDIKIEEFSNKYNMPNNLLKLAKNDQMGYLVLKIVEIIGEDEVQNLDSETIYFITHLLNLLDLDKIRNDILISALPLRI